jgi:hypothetical protein
MRIPDGDLDFIKKVVKSEDDYDNNLESGKPEDFKSESYTMIIKESGNNQDELDKTSK